MISRYIILQLASLFILFNPINAQEYLQKPVPVDPEIISGKLGNGLTYFIRKNKEPEKRASFYFIQNTGALLENDDQNGLAHFLEHMAFNGTFHFPGKKLISSLEKHGVAFGDDINAYTGQDETIYNLSNVPVDSPGLIDSCLLALYDWSHFVSLTDKEIEAERPVIIEEWRTRRDADFRMSKIFLPVLFRGSKYAERDVIGDLDIIKYFRNDNLKQFYFDWYRPDLQAIAVVGDFDPVVIERKVRDLFSQLKPAVNPKSRPSFEIPFHKETLFVLATDKEATQSSLDIYTFHKGTLTTSKNQEYLRQQLMINLMNAMMDVRINELLQKGNPPFISGNISYSEMVRGYDSFDISVASKPGEEDKALTAIYTEAERAGRSGFTPGELERVKANVLTSYDNYYKQKDKIPNDKYINQIENFFLTAEPLPSIDFEYDFVKNVLPTVRPEEISNLYRNLMKDEDRVIIITGPEGRESRHLTEFETKEILAKVRTSEIAAYQDNFVNQNIINEKIEGSKITGTKELRQFGAVEWTLANNAKVVYKKVDYEKDNVTLTAFSPGGSSLYDPDLLPSATMLPAIIGTYGLGDYDNITIQKLMAGRKASASINLGELTEGISGSSTPKDFETMMQLLWLRFEKPRFDREAHEAIISRYNAYYSNMSKDPTKIMQDSVSLFLTNFSPRTMILNTGFLKFVDFEQVRKIYMERFRNASDFTFFIVGNINEDSARIMAEKYIGSIKSYQGKEKWVDRNIRPPKGKYIKDIQLDLAIPKATVFISHNSTFKYDPYNNVVLKVIQGILDIVFTEKVREEAGGTYGVSLSISSQKYPVPQATDLIMFDCDPARVNDLKGIIYRELNNLITKGPGKENLDKVVKNLMKNREESRLHNTYWSNALYSYYFTGVDVNDRKNFEDILKRLTPEDIRKTAAKFYSGADMEEIVFRPKGN
jgi:zinc protease